MAKKILYFYLMSVFTDISTIIGESPDFKLQSRYYLHFQNNIFGEDMNPFIPPAMSS